LNPDFTTTFNLDYYFEKEQWIKFTVYDIDTGGSKDHIGDVETTIAKIMGANNQTYITDLTIPNGGGKSRGKLIVRAESVAQSNDEVSFKVTVRNLRS